MIEENYKELEKLLMRLAVETNASVATVTFVHPDEGDIVIMYKRKKTMANKGK